MAIRDNILEIEEQIRESAEKCGRKREDILLLGVTKLHEPYEIREAVEAGIMDLGENKVQELLSKYDKIEEPVRWHLIGHLQRNKVKDIIDKVYMIHSVDSLRLAKEIDKRAAQKDLTMNILVQVNAAEDDAKFGVKVEETAPLIDSIVKQCPNIRIKGLMCIAPFYEDKNDARPCFRTMKKLYDSYLDDPRDAVDFNYLSMGMSGDFPVAIEEGSNTVRVGTAIFGNRNYRKEEK